MEISTTKKFYFHTRKKARKEKKNLSKGQKPFPWKGGRVGQIEYPVRQRKRKKEVIQKALWIIGSTSLLQQYLTLPTYYAIRWDKLCVIFAQCYCLRVKIFKIISQYIKQLQHNCGDSIFIKALFLYFSI